jgi:Uma2 family endonuclease
MASAVITNPVQTGEPGPNLLPPTADGRLRFKRGLFHQLFDIGVLPRDGRFELIDGEIYMMSPIGPSQGGLISRLMELFVKQLPESLNCRIQLPVVAGDHSEPEPDIAIVQRSADDYQREHPTPGATALIVEVALSSLNFDLGVKLRLYALSGIPEYWVVDVARKLVLVHRDPEGTEYRNVQRCAAGDVIAPAAAQDCKLDVAWLFH